MSASTRFDAERRPARRVATGTTAGRVARGAARALAWASIGVAMLLVSALAHLDSSAGRRVAGQLIAGAIGAQIPGAMTIDRVTHLGARGTLSARGVAFEAPGGARVVWGDRVEADLDVGAALSGAVRLTRLEVIGGGVRVRVPEKGRPSLVRAFSAPGPGGPSEDAVDIDLRSRFEGLSLEVAVEGGPTFAFRALDGFMRLVQSSGGPRVQFDRVEGEWTEPTPVSGAVPVRQLSGLVAAGADRLLDMRFALELGSERLRSRLEYFVDPEPRVRLRLDGSGPKASLAAVGLAGLGATISVLEVERAEVELSDHSR